MILTVDLARQYELVADRIIAAISTELEAGRLFDTSRIEEFEVRFSEFCGVRFGVGVASGTDALLLTLMALDIGEGDEVITTPFTFFATAAAIARNGARPVFVDIDPHTFNMDVDLVEPAISSRTKAILPVDLYGQMAQMDRLEEVANKYGLYLIPDCAQSVGAEFQSRKAGSYGIAGCFSFHPSKNLGAYGDAGLVVTNNEVLAERIRLLRNHGMSRKFYHTMLGIKSNMDVIQAAILNVKLDYLEAWNATRTALATRYTELLTEVDEVTVPFVHPHAKHVFHKYTILASWRDALAQYLWDNGVIVHVYYPLPLHLQHCFAYLGYQEGNFPVAESAAEQVLSLPIYPELTEHEIVTVVQSIKNFYTRSS